MKVEGQDTISIKMDEHKGFIEIIDQRLLPHQLQWEKLKTSEDVAIAIKDMHLRGAPLIGAAAAFGMAFATREALSSKENFHHFLNSRQTHLESTRPTAVNLKWATTSMRRAIDDAPERSRYEAAWQAATRVVHDDIEQCRQIGVHGLKIIEELYCKTGRTINVLTHCNAGWLACLDYGTATSPIYQAYEKGIPIHVWVDETRPRNQGAKLTAWELNAAGVPHTVIPDNTGGHLMQHGMVDLVIVGSDRTTINGDVANKIGTYLKALAAFDNNIPFFAALPKTTFDPTIYDGLNEITIEEREGTEVSHVDGLADSKLYNVQITPNESPTANYGFDVTPARLVTGLITERGVCEATQHSILRMYPEFSSQP